ncbi:MFS transporter [Nocardia inohanensis]|uniref:MFS transporter n=1 Tax=Nocardia inohanensis TaxID=209246 RepID=UPI0008341D41|nr:MFS transporter [Nocardia inohanensis]
MSSLSPGAARTAVAPSETAPPQRIPRIIVLTLCACVALAQSMVAAINLAIPVLTRSGLHPSGEQLLWTVDAYVIVFAGLLIPAGALGDRYGRKGALLTGLAVFMLGATMSALAPNMAVLITGRAVSGAGAAFIMPATMAILVSLAPDAMARGKALAAWTLAVGSGGALGNIGGGLLQQYLPWRALFWSVVPLAALLALAVARCTPRTPRRTASPDPIGAVLLTLGATAILYGIIEGPARGWAAPEVLAGFALGVLLLAVLTAYLLRAKYPLVDPRVFRSRPLRIALLGTATSFFGLFALFFVNAQYLQYAKGFSPALTGLALIPLTLGMMFVPRYAIRVQMRYGAALPAAGGLALIGLGLLAVATADANTPYPLYAVYLVVLSAGMGFCAPVLTTGVIAALPAEQSGMGAGLNTAAREFGAALGVAVIGTALTGSAHDTPDTAAFTDAMGTGLALVGVLVLLAAATVAVGYRTARA